MADDALWNMFINWAFGVRKSIRIESGFKGKVRQIRGLLDNDKTGLINTIIDFMIHSGTVDYSFETENTNFNNILVDWKKDLNKGLSIDIQKGLNPLSAQILRERWITSLVGIKVAWGNKNGYIVPKNIWVLNGQQINIEVKNSGYLGGLEYTLGTEKLVLQNSVNETVIIRKPYNSWYEAEVSPYLAKRGALYNGLVKAELIDKQSEAIEEVIPYIFKIAGGSDEMLRQGQLPTKDEMDNVENSIKKSKEDQLKSLKKGTTTAKTNYSVNFEHLFPDATKFINDVIVKPYDKNLMFALGLIELEGFSSNRQEAILNPKVLVEEVKDAVADTGLIYQDIIDEMADRNKAKHPKFASKNISVVPNKIRSFVTNDMRILARSAYDRGLLDKKTFSEDYLELNFEATVTRRDMERRRNLIERLYPYVIMNQENQINDTKTETPEKVKEQSPEKKKTEKDLEATFNCHDPYCTAVLRIPTEANEKSQIRCSECGYVHSYEEANIKPKEKLVASGDNKKVYDTIDDLPESVKKDLPVGAQIVWLRSFNESVKNEYSECVASENAWASVENVYEKDEASMKWVKK